jgi:hypothetical protein
MSFDFDSMRNDVFDDWLRDMRGDFAPQDNLTEEHLVQLVGATLREVKPEIRAKGFVDLANLCYAMADKTLGSQAPGTKCLEVVVSIGKRH